MRGVKEYAHLDMALLNSADARALDRYAPRLGETYAASPVLKRKDVSETLSGPLPCSTPCSRLAARGSPCSATRASAR